MIYPILHTVTGQLDNPAPFAQILFDAVTSGKWEVVTAAALVLLVAGIRLYGKKLQAALPDENPLDKGLTWLFTNTWGGWTLNLLTAIAGALATALLAGAPVTLGLVGTAIMTALSGAALWELLKDVLAEIQTKKAAEAGEAAALKVVGTPEAVEAINEHTKP